MSKNKRNKLIQKQRMKINMTGKEGSMYDILISMKDGKVVRVEGSPHISVAYAK